MGLLGAMSGGGAAMGDIGSTLFKSAMEEERALRVAEYKGTADAAAADTKFARDKALMDHEAKLKGDKPAVVGKGGALVDNSGKELYRNPDDGGGVGGDSKVKLKNGQVVKESDLRSEYNTRYGRFDPITNKFVMDGDAPTYDEFRNNQVTDEYVRDFSLPGREEPQPETPTTAELERAAAELNTEQDKGFMGFGKYGLGDDEVLARAYQNREASKPGTGGAAAENKAPAQQKKQQTQIPDAALKTLSEGKVTTFKNGQKWTIQNGKPVRVE